MKLHTVIAIAVLAAAPVTAMAQSTTVEGAHRGAADGGAAAGPIGAIVGGTVGAAVGAAVEVPNAVINSVRAANEPSVVVQEPVVVGQPLPSTVVLREVPSHTEYRYAIVNNQRVIVDPGTRRVIQVIE
jgi:hypothetical protein